MYPKNLGRIVFYCGMATILSVAFLSYALVINGYTSGVAIWLGLLIGFFTGLLGAELFR